MSMVKKTSSFALFALLTGAAGISFAPIFVRLSDVGPVAKAFWRLFFALPVLWTMVCVSPGRRDPGIFPHSKSEYGLMTAAGLFFAADLVVWHLSLKFTTVANATLLPNFAPVFVVLGGWFLLKERVHRFFILGMALALAGTVLVVGTSYRIDIERFWGDVLGLTAAVFYAGYILSVKSLRSRFSTVVVMAYTGVVTCIGVLSVAVILGEKIVPASTRGWMVLIAMGIISHAGGQGLIAYALAHLKAGFSSLGLLLQPVLAAIWAWILFSERLGPIQAMGGLLVLSGILLARKDSR